jgi:hypothetical protein
MSAGFDKAYAAFREHVATILKVKPDQVQVGPSYEEAANDFKETVGRAWGLRGFRKDDPPQAVQGWATAEGIVITPQQNLGLLFEEAGVWTESPGLDAGELASRLIWAMGMNHRVFIEPSLSVPEPALNIDDGGTGALVFFVAYRQPGPGGAGGGPEDIFKVTVALTPDHKATFEKAPFQIP